MSNSSAYYIAVKKILSKVSGATLSDFSQCKTDEDRINFALGLEHINLLDVNPQFDAKSLSESVANRERGNNFYKDGSYKDALDCYTKSVLLAPNMKAGFDKENEQGGKKSGLKEELPLALGNRSATLYQMGRYKEAISDIDLALKNKFPSRIQYKLYDRKGRCLMALDKFEEAIECFQQVKAVLDSAKLTQKQKDKIIENSDEQIENCKHKNPGNAKRAFVSQRSISMDTTSNINEETGEFIVPQVPGNNVRFPGASDSFDVKYAANKGRYSKATNDIGVGEAVLTEEPFSSVLDPKAYHLRCFHCFKYLSSAPISCISCTAARYCSEKCQISSWDTYHKEECQFLGALSASGTGFISHLALRTIIIAGLPIILKCKRNPKADSDETQKALFTDSKGVYMGGFVGLYNLLSHTQHRSQNDILQYTILAVFLLRILQKSEFLKNKPGNIEFAEAKLEATVGAVLLRFLQIISCNGIEVTEMVKGNYLQKCDPEAFALALYPTFSLINHSCNPAMELIFYNNTCVARAIRNIAEGEELTIDYGYIYYSTTKSQRQFYLASQYFFDCVCEACTQNWPVKSALKNDLPRLKCIECQMPMGLFGTGDLDSLECQTCGFVQNPLELFDTLRTSSAAFEKSLILARSFAIDEAIPTLEEHMCMMDSYVVPPWKEYTTCLSTLKQCYRMDGNVKRSNMLT